MADYSKPDPKENRPDDFESMLDSIIEIGSKRNKLRKREMVIIGDIDSKIHDLKMRRIDHNSDTELNIIAQQSGITPFSNQQSVNIQGGTTIIHKGSILRI